MNEAERKLWSDYNAAAAALKRQLKTKQGGKKDEARFAAAYRALVRAGLAMPLKKKYTVDK